MSRPLTIAMPIHSFEPGGVERVALHLAEAWYAQGCDVAVILGRSAGAMAAHAPDLPYIRNDTRLSTASFETTWMIRCLYRYLRDHPVDVLFCPGNTYTIVAFAMRRLLGAACPPIIAKISNDLHRPDMQRLIRCGYRQWLRLQGSAIDQFVSMADAMRPEIASAMQVASDRITTICDPALTSAQMASLSAPRTAVAGPPAFLAVGRLAEQKNVAMMLRGFARGAPAQATLTLLGDGPDRAQLVTLAQQLGIGGRVRFAGYIADTTPWFRRSSALLLTSHYEGVPAVVIEALAAGVPVIATACSKAMPDLLGHGRFGTLTPLGDTAAFADALRQFDARAYDRTGAIAAASAYSIPQAAGQYLDHMRHIAACRSGRTAAAHLQMPLQQDTHYAR